MHLSHLITILHNLQLQANSEKWRYCWLFEVGSMRNAHLKTVRNLWKEYASVFCAKNVHNDLYFLSSARIFFGRGAVMAKALGTTPEEEHRLGLSKLATVCTQSFFPS